MFLGILSGYCWAEWHDVCGCCDPASVVMLSLSSLANAGSVVRGLVTVSAITVPDILDVVVVVVVVELRYRCRYDGDEFRRRRYRQILMRLERVHQRSGLAQDIPILKFDFKELLITFPLSQLSLYLSTV